MPRRSPTSASKGMYISNAHECLHIQPLPCNIYIYSLIYMAALHVVSKGMRILHNLEAEQGLHYLLLIAKSIRTFTSASRINGFTVHHFNQPVSATAHGTYYQVSSRLAKASLPKPRPSLLAASSRTHELLRSCSYARTPLAFFAARCLHAVEGKLLPNIFTCSMTSEGGQAKKNILAL